MLDNCYQRETIEAGCDEAGRGCLAGSVFAAAVILPPDFSHPLLNDSKQMTERRRDMLREIIEREAVAWAVSEVTAERIDKINILNASIEAMNAAVARLSVVPGFLVIDGNRFNTASQIPFRCIVKGDGRHSSRLGAGQDPPRRVYAPLRPGVSGIRLVEEQGLSDARPQTRHTPARPLAVSSSYVQPRYRPAGAVLAHGRHSSAGGRYTHTSRHAGHTAHGLPERCLPVGLAAEGSTGHCRRREKYGR